MPLVLYNTMTHRKEVFEPLDPGMVRMYVCGPTVYDVAHIGNARAVVVFDQLYRVLRETYGADHVRYVRNITDIDDKIINAARDTGEPIEALTSRTAATFHADMAALGALPPDIEPRATEHVAQMIAMIERLIGGGHAYAAEGHVLFAVDSWAGYGRLSRRSRDELIAGARVEVAPYKRDPGDFVLWKPSTPDQPGWDSPWGRGRPGWHIECSAMSEAYLGETFDIHGGGVDLVFPHHENELAQSECAHDGRPFVRFWVHNGFLSVDSTKMSKSLGNFVTAHELLDHGIPGEVLRLALLSTHYRDPLDWTQERLDQAKQALDRWYRYLDQKPMGKINSEKAKEIAGSVLKDLQDDLNTPLAMSHLHQLTKPPGFYLDVSFLDVDFLDRSPLGDDLATRQEALRMAAGWMGLLRADPVEWFRRPSDDNAAIEARIAERARAREERRFAEADRIRAELMADGIVLEDKPGGTTEWRRA